MISKCNVKFTDSEVRMASRFASSNQQEIEKLLEDKDLENTKRSTKVAKELFYEYLNPIQTGGGGAFRTPPPAKS